MLRRGGHRDDPSLAIERTVLAWDRTAASFAVLGALGLRLVADVEVGAAVALPAFATAVVAWVYGSRRIVEQRRLPPAWVLAAVAAGAAVTGLAGVAAWAMTG